MAMAEQYKESVRKRNERSTKRRRGGVVFLAVLDSFIALFSLLLAFATVVAILSHYISPERMQVLSVVTLAAPVVYLLDLVVMFYWVLRRRIILLVATFAVAVAGTCYLSLYYKVDLTRHYETKYVERNFIRILSYNTFGGSKQGLADYILSRNADVICLQEASRNSSNWATLSAKYASTPATDMDNASVILTRHKILRSGAIDSLPLKKLLWADVKIGKKVVRVLNLHLHSTSIKPEDTQFIEEHHYLHDTARTSKIGSIVSRLVENNCRRAVEAEKVRQWVEQSPYDVIVCGDFNDVPLSYTYRTILGDNLVDAFESVADGYAYTFNRYFNLLRIDHIFHSPTIETISYEVDYNASYSDHFPVFVRLKLK